jgi:hypothetical protein
MDIVLPKDFAAEDAAQVLEQARSVLNLPSDSKLHVENVAQTQRGTRIDFTYTVLVSLDDVDLDEITGVHVRVSAHGDLKFDAHGALVAYAIEPADPRQLRALCDHLRKLVADGRIYVAQKGETVDPAELHAQGKEWYIVQDEDGNKCLQRAWIS